MQTLDLELDDVRDAPPKPRKARAKAWSGPRPLNHPEATEQTLEHEMSLVSSSIRCCNWATAAYHATRAANVYAELSPGVLMVVAQNGFADAPSPLGDWSTGAWIAWSVAHAIKGYVPCDDGDWCPPDPPLSEFHSRDYEYMREVFCRG